MSTPACPKCGGPMFEEKLSKYWNGGKTKEGKPKPEYKCRDKGNCDGVIWPPKPQPGATTPAVGDRGRAGQTRPVAPLYNECLGLAKQILLKQFGTDYTYTTADILNAAACMYISASRDGMPLLPPKPAPKPIPEDDEAFHNDYRVNDV